MSLPETMTAIAIRGGAGPAEALHPVSIPTPRPAPGQILIRVAAAGINRPDVLQRNGGYAPPPGAPETMGLEVAGEVVALGEGAARWTVGDRVCALLGGGGYAEYAVVDARHALPIPDGLDLVQAAALPETAFTVWANLFDRGGLKAGETALIHGGSSGIGTLAIQLAVARGARVIATAGSPEKVAACERLGADPAIDYHRQDFVAEVKAATGGRGADVILDMVGGDYLGRNMQAAAEGGRIVVIAVQGGRTAEIDLARLMQKRLVLTGCGTACHAAMVG